MSRPLSLMLSLSLSAAVIGLAAGPASAQTYGAQSRYAPQGAVSYEQCVRQQRNRQVAGAVIGGILGAVIGAELHDDAQDRSRDRGRGYRGDRHYRGGHYDRDYGRGRHRGYRGRQHEEGNDGAVVAGGAVGAVAGAAIAGSGDCDRYARTGYGYGQAPGHYGADTYRGGYQGDAYGGGQPIYDESGRVYADEYGYASSDPYAQDYGYDQRSSGQLLGGEDYRGDSRTYSASSPSGPVSTGPCQQMRSGNGALVLMCQGPDGIWRPA